ncbi:DUF4169 family protein [Ancylobacter lacus]|uniref:DUF4169 family protein n=1 Tax=Ancylobacter lacus TaxID=2579970 RepID=UPI001BD00439|nr:DUF4169 family protein [Ancylobacter lacus]MBS7541461.1 DUF4169 family protein [Ancylobacter lacus]
MSEIVNLRRFRKKLAREAREQTAAARRYQFGRSKDEREAEEARERMRQNALEGHRRVQGDET